MGQTLSEPVVEKKSDHGQDDRVIYGVSSMQGWRISMEDAHACILDLQPQNGGEQKPADANVAIYTGENLHKIIAKQDAFKSGDIEQALKDGFLATDRAILSDPRYEEEVSGCTASVGIITKDKIYVANAGDSRSVLGIKGRAKPLSFDHKPQNEARICAAGGFVDFGRVNGNLALSRAIGDFEFKKSADLPPEQQIVTAFPDVTVHDITDDDEFLVVACDGIWDCQSSQAVVEFVRRGIAAKQELQAICENMMDNCLASNSDTGGVGCDNMTMIIVGLLKGKTKDEWYKEIADRVANGDGPCAPPEYDDSPEDYEMDMDHGPRHGMSNRVILLGDGSEINHDSADSEMFDHDEEDKDLKSQVNKGGAGDNDSAYGSDNRSQREGTPSRDSNGQNPSSGQSDSPSSTATDRSEEAEHHKHQAEHHKRQAEQSLKNQQNDRHSSTPAEPKMMAATDGAVDSMK
ncbi:Protein phosphatase 2C 2 [Coniosporium tulheliwenetii]|uniref:Protein phosphatase 2C 2 n=1 Tax=Coniosporium tulheliwenetii TaxID=3383036 RepID=A0ACC2Z5C0_9PEZI|nr:Protein phosphatase 2C 2 [Cladosporium sp. JES 115]